MTGAEYVGMLERVATEEGDREGFEVRRCALGIDPEMGLVTAPTRAALSRGEYTARPNGRSAPLTRVWYSRTRKNYPGGAFWYHDLDKARVIAEGNGSEPPAVYVQSDTATICPGEPGSFLCH